MYKRYYSGYDDCGCTALPAVPEACEECAAPVPVGDCGCEKKILGPFAADDILLIGVFLFLLHEQCEDKLMLTVIGLILLSGF